MKKKIEFEKEFLLNRLTEIVETKENMLILNVSRRGMDYVKHICKNNSSLENDFIFMEKVKSPINKDTTIAIITETKDFLLIEELIESFEITYDFVYSEIERVYEEKILKDLYQFRGGESIISLANRDILLVDEGINTGLNMLAAIKSCINQNASTISVAAPIVSKESALVINNLVDNTFFLYEIDDFIDIDFYIKEN